MIQKSAQELANFFGVYITRCDNGIQFWDHKPRYSPNDDEFAINNEYGIDVDESWFDTICSDYLNRCEIVSPNNKPLVKGDKLFNSDGDDKLISQVVTYISAGLCSNGVSQFPISEYALFDSDFSGLTIKELKSSLKVLGNKPKKNTKTTTRSTKEIK